jgi:hypothetical protein
MKWSDSGHPPIISSTSILISSAVYLAYFLLLSHSFLELSLFYLTRIFVFLSCFLFSFFISFLHIRISSHLTFSLYISHKPTSGPYVIYSLKQTDIGIIRRPESAFRRRHGVGIVCTLPSSQPLTFLNTVSFYKITGSSKQIIVKANYRDEVVCLLTWEGKNKAAATALTSLLELLTTNLTIIPGVLTHFSVTYRNKIVGWLCTRNWKCCGMERSWLILR